MNQNNPKRNEELKNCTVRPLIIIGSTIPNEIQFSYDGGGGFTNMGSYRIDSLFRKHLKTMQDEEYIFSEICRNKNEKKAFEMAIKENLESIGYKLTGWYNEQTKSIVNDTTDYDFIYDAPLTC